ncbi:MAG TPA: HD domain-containing phosphohydrolase, partial [Polyangiaceae bacterium]|nr:HD domain-containing phosphohydrolase [Polyangiaceae bacterium]
DPETGRIVQFSEEDQHLAESLAAQAGIALHNHVLLEEQRILLERFIKVLAAAIDAKSPYTGGHCERVPVIAEMLIGALCEDSSETFADFDMTEEERYEFRIAAWLHDCGKVVTPPHVMDKATKLEAIHDRIHMVRDRIEILRRDAELEAARKVMAGQLSWQQASTMAKEKSAELDDILTFLERVNMGSEDLADSDVQRIQQIAELQYRKGGEWVPLLTADEVSNLSVRRGTLTESERIVINGHMVQTISMLESLPFPRMLKRVPEYAGGHHERMDAKGYPRGIHAGTMSLPARVMAVADVFEALTARDRPYKRGKPLSEAMRIMGQMKKNNHLDPDIFDLFVRAGVYRVYAQRFLSPEQIDEVDEQALLSIVPRPFDCLPTHEQEMRKNTFLPEYEDQRHRSVHPPPVTVPSEWSFHSK